MFDYRQKASADHMRTSWEKLVQYVGTNYSQDISNKLPNKQTVTIAEPVHSTATLARHATREALIRTAQQNIHAACLAQETILQVEVVAGNDPEAPIKLAILQNEIAQGEFDANEEVPIKLNDSKKTQSSNAWHTY